jgi:hypothetical protein
MAVAGLALLAATTVEAQRVTTPQQQFGHEIGADYVLPDYTQLMEYWQKLATESDRMVLDTIGLTEEGRPQLMAIITSPENHGNLDRYREINRRIAMADGLTDEQARQLISEAKPVVWFDGGLHATETLGAQQLMETVYQLVSGTDQETLRFLDDLIILAVHANPDGMELVSDWYMREPNPEDRSSGGLPRLYQKYTGHDNNRDFYASTQSETENMNRAAYIEWNPIILYNHHQSGPAGTVMFSPPFRDPPNYYFDPAILTGLEIVGGAMHGRFIEENKPGVTTRSGASYSTWWNGGLRTMAYFHNILGLLTETIGNPTPSQIPFIPGRVQPSSDLPLPIEPQEWHFRQSVDYSVTANRAVFDIASKRGEDFLFAMYQMAKRAIEKGSTDTWTDTPADIALATAALSDGDQGGRGGGFGGGRGARGSADSFREILRDPALRDPRGYIMPSDQPDFPTVAKFLEALAETGVFVHRATAEFQANGRTYPAGSFVVKTAQPYRAHVLDMFEQQHHPSDLAYPGGPPIPPYDVAGWTLAYQMGVQFDRVLEAFDGPFELLPDFVVPPMPGRITGSGNAGWFMSHQANDAFVAINRLMAEGRDVFWLNEPVTAGGASHPVGTFFIPRGGDSERIVQEMAETKGLNFVRTGSRPNAQAFEVQPVRIGLWDRYGGSMPSGWVRWILEQFEFPFEVVYPRALDAGDLNRQFDVLIFVDGAIPSGGGGRGGGGGGNVPAEFEHMTGNVSVDRTVPQLRAFMEAGGTVITIGSSTVLAEHLDLPVADAMTRLVDGELQGLPRSEYYIPGSILQARVDNTQPIAHGLPERVDFFFDNSPVMKLLPASSMEGVRPVAWFDSAEPLRSGWGHGMRYLEGGVAAAAAEVGQGKLYLFGPEITFRAQPHGTFRFLFNGIYFGSAEPTSLR